MRQEKKKRWSGGWTVITVKDNLKDVQAEYCLSLFKRNTLLRYSNTSSFVPLLIWYIFCGHSLDSSLPLCVGILVSTHSQLPLDTADFGWETSVSFHTVVFYPHDSLNIYLFFISSRGNCPTAFQTDCIFACVGVGGGGRTAVWVQIDGSATDGD